MPSERLALALEQMQAGDWSIFERFAAEFLAVEFPSLRTTASAGGDRGRDGELYKVAEAAKTVFQYSVSQEWKAKIKATVKVLADTMPDITRLVYCTNQVIGPAADDLKEELRRTSLSLDVRDRSWFVDRELTYPQRAAASEELAQRFVTPLLAARGVAERVGPTLTNDDARLALLHLTLEGYDHHSEKGLTKSCFESLVLAALHDTRAEQARELTDIFSAVAESVPVAEAGQLRAHVEGAVKRLSVRNGPVKQVGKSSSFHLSHEEQGRVAESTARFLLHQEEVDLEFQTVLEQLGVAGDRVATAAALRRGLEAVLLRRGEHFASAVTTGQASHVDVEEVLAALTEAGTPLLNISKTAAAEVILEILENPTKATAEHLRRIADGYTLFAFLRQTADVQKVIVQVFSDGDVWLDTTAVLPLLAETLLVDPAERHFTVLLQAAREAGLRLFVTDGIVEEVERHINRCLSYARMSSSEWQGRVPFLYGAYTLSGRGRADFAAWSDEFRGTQTPEEDVKEFLHDLYRIQNRNLDIETAAAPDELRAAVQEVWHIAHDKRRGRGPAGGDLTPAVTLRLVAHDVENCVGIMQLRKQSPPSPMGYRTWWLTLDRVAFRLREELEKRMAGQVPPSPALSPDFLTELLRLGPLRAAIERESHVTLPVVLDISRFESLPRELIDLADQVRRDAEGQTERLIQRNVKEALNAARWRRGPQAEGGIQAAEDRIQARLSAQLARS